MDLPLHPHLKLVVDVTEGLSVLARQMARAAARSAAERRPARHATLRPGPDTPCWNALVAAVRPHLRRRGGKTNLGRELGVPPQRIHEYFVARTAAPDAERTLQLVGWLAARTPAAPARAAAARE